MNKLPEQDKPKEASLLSKSVVERCAMLRPSDEARRVWKEKFPHYDQATLSQGMTITPSKLSEMLNNKREFSLRIIRYLVACGADAEIMIRDNTIGT